MTSQAHRGPPSAEDEVAYLSRQVVRACVLFGLAGPDAEDVSQDVLQWLIESGNLAMAFLAPWLAAVVHNFVLRFGRRRRRERGLFLGHGFPDSRCESHGQVVEARVFLEQLASLAPLSDRKLLALMGSGYRLSEAAHQSGIPHGSEQFHLRRIRTLARSLSRKTSP
jgi:DNA-directed RNA polymerase specialized sigma24 family protein